MFMSSRVTAVLLLAYLAACAPEIEHRDPDVTVISIVGTNDLHGAILSANGYGGLGVFSAYVNNLRAMRAADGGTVLLIDAGDMWQGTLESNINEGAIVVQAYNALGYDAAAIGNHEFDYGPTGPMPTPVTDSDDARGALKARAAEAAFPILAANLIDVGTGQPVDWPNVSPSITIDSAGVKVGIVGVLTEYALSTTHLANIQGLSVAPLVSTIRDEAEKLRRNGVDMVIVTAHAGSECLEFDDPDDLTSCRMDGEIFRVAQELPTGLVNVIIAGHEHKGIAHNINGISVISAFSRGQSFGRVDIGVDRNQALITSKSVFPPTRICEFRVSADECSNDTKAGPPSVYAGATIVRDTAIEALIKPVIDDVRKYKMQQVGVDVEAGFNRSGIPESALGNLFASAMLETAGNADIAIHNNVGGIRADIPPGPQTYGSIYDIFPFDNRVVLLSISGADLRTVFQNQLGNGDWHAGVAGIRLSAECRDSQLFVTMLRNDGRAVSDEEILLVATTDFLAIGGNNIFSPIMPPGGFVTDPNAPLFRERLATWFERRGGFLRLADFYEPSEARFTYPGSIPISCTGTT